MPFENLEALSDSGSEPRSDDDELGEAPASDDDERAAAAEKPSSSSQPVVIGPFSEAMMTTSLSKMFMGHAARRACQLA